MPYQIKLDLRALAWVALIAATIFILFKIPTTIFIFLVGFLFYIILDPIVEYLCKFYNSRSLWVSVILVFVFVLIILVFSFIIPLVINESFKFINNIPIYTQQLKAIVRDYKIFLSQADQIARTNLSFSITENINQYLSHMGENLSSTLSRFLSLSLGIFSNLFYFVMSLMIAVYLIIDEKKVASFLKNNLPPKVLSLRKELWEEIGDNLSNYFRGLLLMAFILFLLSLISFIILGVNFGFILALWISITVIIPYVGPFLGSIPAVGIAFLQGSTIGIWVAITQILFQFVVANIIGPRIMAKSIGIHPIAVILILLAGGELAGVAGMIFAVPIAAVVFTFLKYYWAEFIKPKH